MTHDLGTVNTCILRIGNSSVKKLTNSHNVKSPLRCWWIRDLNLTPDLRFFSRPTVLICVEFTISEVELGDNIINPYAC